MSMYFAFNVKLYTLNSAPQFLFFSLWWGGGGGGGFIRWGAFVFNM